MTVAPFLAEHDLQRAGTVTDRVTSVWDGLLETLIPNPPKITSGKVVAHGNGVTVS